MTQGMINKLVTVLETTLSKLSRYDEGSFIGSILSLTVIYNLVGVGSSMYNFSSLRNLFQKVSGSGKEMGQAYVSFTRNCIDQIRGKVSDELWILTFFEVNFTTNSLSSCRPLQTPMFVKLVFAAMVHRSNPNAV